MKNLPEWELKVLFKSINDKNIAKSLKKSEKEVASFCRKYKGKIKQRIKNSKSLYVALDEYSRIFQDLVKPIHYARLKFSESQSDGKVAKFFQKMQVEYQRISSELLFFEIEILEVNNKSLKAFSKTKNYTEYAYFIEKLIKNKKHKLSLRDEKLISDYSLTGRKALVRLYDEEKAYKTYEVKLGKKIKTLSLTESLHLLHSKDRKQRASAHKGISTGLKQEARRSAFIFNNLIQNKFTSDKYRDYKEPEISRHNENDTNKETVNIMCDVIVSNYKLVHKFYKKKQKLLKLKTVYDYDRYAPISKSTKKYSVAQAKSLVLDAFYSFSEKKGKIAEIFFDKNWIDFKKRPGKRGGAYCAFVTPDTNPFVFMNYEGSLRDVSTLAHELGHAVHAYLMGELKYINFDVPLTLAETASVFSEMLLFDYMKDKLKSESEKQALYVAKIDDSFATVYRQVSMFLFERDFYSAVKNTGEQSAEQINAIWRKRQTEMYGKSVTLTSEYDLWWSYIPHFIHTPFYVYAYAFGELLTLSLYNNYKENGDAFVDKYLNFLSLGGTKKPEQLLRPLGVNLKSKEFWQGGINSLKEIVDLI